MLVDEQKNVFLIDWDGAQIGYPEQDLWFYINLKYENAFFGGYNSIIPDFKLDIDLLAFHLYYRVLEDLTEWLNRILFENENDLQNENDINGLMDDVIPVISNIRTIYSEFRNKIAKIDTDAVTSES